MFFMSDYLEKKMIEQLWNGSEKAFGEVFRQYYRGLCAYSYTILKDHHAAEEKILPTSFRIMPTIKENTVYFEIEKPQHVTVEVNGDHIRSLHLFANPEETKLSLKKKQYKNKSE